MNKEQLAEKINELSDKSLFESLSPEDEMWLATYKEAYDKMIQDEVVIGDKAREEKSREMRNRRRRGKYGEKRIAKQIGGRVDGRSGKKDVRKGMFYFEVKSNKSTPKKDDKDMAEANSHCPKGQIAVVVRRNTTTRTAKAILDWNDFVGLHGGK